MEMKLKAQIVKIGNSQGVRIPRSAIEQAGLPSEVELLVERGKVSIVPDPDTLITGDMVAMSSQSLAQNWNRLEEDRAWSSLPLVA
jgi:antitoxin MazE